MPGYTPDRPSPLIRSTPAEHAYPVIEDTLARYRYQRREGFKDKH